MGIIGWVVLGLLAGLIAKAVMPGKDPGGFIVTAVIGVVGALIGGFIGNAIFGGGLQDFFSIRTWLLAILGSLILLAVYRVTIGKKTHHHA
ncbi:transglycosylase-associated protein [Actinokineospora spheciospongiae]|uniref:Transglycosylase-associated protein n=1 Tax=Actinokineospora spheciospongiae TaxID=909613 RepID=W7IRY2_9PSEU|nr:GlsB/YeaQ/YmgE family stress response membrane protein [Actinokineospora spheciospongiae]EWC59226.1 transglycosylase-associated protein [Actinokineospora spheciospongiae]PWW63168.1 putative membrane protein YeaQ/YmgE (transglycosylase-associated protein family) [Actinokineospora spheciospongiae]